MKNLFSIKCVLMALAKINPVQEFGMPETPRTATWCGRKLIVGFKKEYALVEVVVDLPLLYPHVTDETWYDLGDPEFATVAQLVEC